MSLALAQGGYSARFLGAACVLVWWAVVVVALARRHRQEPRRATRVLTVGSLAALAALSALSMGWASDGGAAFVAAVRAAVYAGIVALVVLAARGGEMRPWIDGLAIGIALVAILALGSRLESGLPGSDADIARFLPSAAGRLSYPIGYWNGLAALLAMGLVLLTYLAGEARTTPVRALAVAAIPVEGLAVYYTSSRGGVAAAVVGLVVLVALVPARSRTLASAALAGAGTGVLVLLASHRGALLDGLGRPGAAAQGHQMVVATIIVVSVVGLVRLALDRPLGRLAIPRGLGRALAAGVAVLAVVAIAVANPSRRLDEFKALPTGAAQGSGFVASHLASGNGSGRWQYWSAAKSAFTSEPVHGIGAGGYESLVEPAWISVDAGEERPLAASSRRSPSWACSESPCQSPSSRSRRLPGRGRLRTPARPDTAAALAVLATGAVSAAVDWTFQLPATFLPVLVVAGLLVATPPAGGPEQAAAGFGGRRWPRIAAIAFGVAAIWAGALLFASEQRIADSQAAVRAGDLPGAAEAAADAASLEPWAAAPKLQLALVQELGGDIAAARSAIQDAIDLAPEDWRLRWWRPASTLARATWLVGGPPFGAPRPSTRWRRSLRPPQGDAVKRRLETRPDAQRERERLQA